MSPTPIVRIVPPSILPPIRRARPIQTFHMRHGLEYLFYSYRLHDHSAGGRGRRAALFGKVALGEKDERPGNHRTAGELRRIPAPPDRDRAASAQASQASRGLRARAPG